MTSIPVLMLAAVAIAGGEVAVLEDFEASAVKGWQGNVQVSKERAAHGAQSGKLTLDGPRAEVLLTPARRDWSGFG